MDDHDFSVLGDLRPTLYEGGERADAGDFIVRMFVGEQTFDEQITCDIHELREIVTGRMKALAKKPNETLLVEAERPHPALNNGHAIEVP